MTRGTRCHGPTHRIRRPDDSRYGDNPNRPQTHTQFQVFDAVLVMDPAAGVLDWPTL